MELGLNRARDYDLIISSRKWRIKFNLKQHNAQLLRMERLRLEKKSSDVICEVLIILSVKKCYGHNNFINMHEN